MCNGDPAHTRTHARSHSLKHSESSVPGVLQTVRPDVEHVVFRCSPTRAALPLTLGFLHFFSYFVGSLQLLLLLLLLLVLDQDPPSPQHLLILRRLHSNNRLLQLFDFSFTLTKVH